MAPIDIAKFEQLKATGDIPSPKGVALAIMRLTQREDFSMAELAHVVSSDPAFVGRLIKAANGAANAGQRPVASVSDALKVVGVSAVRTLALGLSLLSNFRTGKCRNFDYPGFWSHSLVRGIALQTLMMQSRTIPPDEAFSVGLLARIGDLALATLFSVDYSRLLDQASDRAQLSALERAAFAMTHSELTAAMLKDWGFPSVFVEPVLFHEDVSASHFEEGSRLFKLVHALRLADYIADICLASEAKWQAMMPELFALGGMLSLDGEVLMTLCDKVTKDWLDWGVILQVETRDIPSFDALAHPAATESEKAIPGGESASMSILLVDTDAAARSALHSTLVAAGYLVDEAEDGQRAFERVLESHPQIVIADWLLPQLSGVELTRALRETAVGRTTYILILGSGESDDAVVDAFEGGADDFMAKPVKSEVLLARLRGGQRMVNLQREVERDREEIRRFAADLAIANRRLQQVARTDSLTSFPNRRYAMERIQQEWKAAERNQRALCCMVVDVDCFKQINDRYGHDVGDAALRHAAAVLKEGLRAQDVICRTGGDEFLIICPDTSLEPAMKCAERVRQSLEHAALMLGGTRSR
ncbi:HDOD domain-containing protein [Denitratisoma sp. DHT3]|uniref:GGDEF domain-containing response regulator n=1 Tax=Denitratisoma sp. DHT3 TaxID=1981880 RepID=UPI0021BD8103|nr:HDOD domain-containing protein [Denitratisoma sp. DHT3]